MLLAVGAVLLVTAAAALASAYGGALAQLLLLLASAGVAGLSLRATGARLRSSAETLAACAAGLGLAGRTHLQRDRISSPEIVGDVSWEDDSQSGVEEELLQRLMGSPASNPLVHSYLI